jgi:murein DD-endopeptidase MepM/ murein hydrolase activator NlpD
MRNRLEGIWRAYGFYVSVTVCVLLLGGAAYWARNWPTAEPTPTAAPADAAPGFVESLADVLADPTPTPAPTPEPKPEFGWPLERADAEVMLEYSPDAPVWSDTLKQWQVHAAIDIQGVVGEVVLVAASGTVTRAYADALMGNVVEIAHDMGYVTRYASLGTHQMVSVGDRVSRGDVIGSVGTSATAESAAPAHLHFEAERSGVLMDPMSLYD